MVEGNRDGTARYIETHHLKSNPAIQEQQEIIDGLKGENENQQTQIERLWEKIQELEARLGD